MTKKKLYSAVLILSLVSLLILVPAGCASAPEGALDCCECLEAKQYDTQVTVYGKVSMLGELQSSSFILTSGGEELPVWYDTMVEDDGTKWPAVSVAGIKNGDRLVVTGELKSAGKYRKPGDFWAKKIEKY